MAAHAATAIGIAPRRAPQRGFSYIGLLIGVAIMGVMLSAIGEAWQITRQREKEDELLYVGDQFRIAIGNYYQQTPGRAKQLPASLQDLLKDPRYPNTRRYLRKIYVDPMTGNADWGLIKAANGAIFGVFSRSEAEPLKKARFPLAYQYFEGRKKYSEWQFLFATQPNQAVPLQTPASPLIIDAGSLPTIKP